MAIYRTIQLTFWSDEKILDEFTPEDKYFYLYLFTNPQTNLCGCYQLGWNQTTSQTGYTRESIMRLIDRFINTHGVIRYSNTTKEVLILNWHKYNWTTSGRFLISLRKEVEAVKDVEFSQYLKNLFNKYLEDALANKDIKERELDMLKKIEFFELDDTVCIPYAYRMHTTVTVTDTDTVNNNIYKDIKRKETDIPKGISLKKRKNQSTANAEIDDLFERVWSIYPKKKGKAQVSSKQKRVLFDIGYEHLERCVERFTRQMAKEKRDSQYVMQGSTFFNSGYVDYLDDNYNEKDGEINGNANFVKKPDEGTFLDLLD